MTGVLAFESDIMPTDGVLAELALCGVAASWRSCHIGRCGVLCQSLKHMAAERGPPRECRLGPLYGRT